MSLLNRIRALWNRSRIEREIRDEIESHIEMRTADNIATGMDQEEARRDAVLRFGNPTATKERVAEADSLLLFDRLWADLRFAVRQLRRSAGFTVSAVLTLGLGVGASVAVFAFCDGVLIRSLPYDRPEQLVQVTEGTVRMPDSYLSYPNYLDWKRQNQVFSSIAAWTPTSYVVKTDAATSQASGARVSDNFFRTLGIIPQFGRDFLPKDGAPSAAPVVILSDAAWRAWLGGSKNAIGMTISLSDVSYVVIGVLPKDYYFAPRGLAQFWVPVQALSASDQRRTFRNWFCVGRLKGGTSFTTAQENMKSISSTLASRFPDANRDETSKVIPLSEATYGQIRPVLIALFCGAILLLLIAALNVACLLLVRSEGRAREIAVRSVLGATRMRLIGQFATEGVMLATMGSAIGLFFSLLCIRAVTNFIPEETLFEMPYLRGIQLSAHSLIFIGIISVGLTTLFSLTPILRLTKDRMQSDLSSGGRATRSLAWRRFSFALVIAELSVAVVLLVSAGLLGKSLYRLLHVELGFTAESLSTLTVLAPADRYGESEQQVAMERNVLTAVRQLPGVTCVGTGHLPVSDNRPETWIRQFGQPFHGEHNEVGYRVVSPDFFRTLKAALVSGRYFSENDDRSRPLVAIINKALAQRYFAGENPIGKKLGNYDLSVVREVVGVVDNVREGGLDEEIWPAMYLPYNQAPTIGFSLVVRSTQDPDSLLPTLVSSIHQIDPTISTFDIVSMKDEINQSPSAYLRRSAAALVGGYSALAFIVSVVGLYGVIAYSTSQRIQEVGIRIALGAQRRSIFQLFLREAAWLILIGIGTGILGSIGVATLAKSILFRTASYDISTFATASIVLTIATLSASYLPARRAASISPVEALRAE